MKLIDTMNEYIKKTGNFPGNEYWAKKWEKAYNADLSKNNSKPIDYKTAFNELATCIRFGMTVENTKKQFDEILIKHKIKRLA